MLAGLALYTEATADNYLTPISTDGDQSSAAPEATGGCLLNSCDFALKPKNSSGTKGDGEQETPEGEIKEEGERAFMKM
jgi:hypothetical protein